MLDRCRFQIGFQIQPSTRAFSRKGGDRLMSSYLPAVCEPQFDRLPRYSRRWQAGTLRLSPKVATDFVGKRQVEIAHV